MTLSRCDQAGFRLLFGLALMLATWFALSPQPELMRYPPPADKAVHALTYLVLALLADAGWPQARFDTRKWALLLGYGLLIELIQLALPGRVFSLADLAANASGIAVYAFLGAPLMRGRGLR